MTKNSISRRTVISAAAATAALPAATASAAPAADPNAIVAAIAALGDAEAQDQAITALSSALRARFRKIIVADHIVEQAATLLSDHRDPQSFLARHGSLDHASKWTEADLREALTGQKLHPRVERDGVPFDLEEDA